MTDINDIVNEFKET